MAITRIYMEPYDAAKHGKLRRFDNTKLVALNTCPTWGIVRYEHHKTYLSGGRAMPLEAGKAAHEAYAAIRIADLWFNGHHFYPEYNVRAITTARALQLFGPERWEGIKGVLESGEDIERATMLAALEAFGSSGFYEDPNDRRRTIANIEEALIAYVTRYPLGKTIAAIIPHDAGVVNVDGARYFVGVEIPINMYLRIETDERTDDEGIHFANGPKTYEFQFVGRVDGVHYTASDLTELAVEENKTSSRLDDAWRLSFTISHQPTGYLIAVSTILNLDVRKAVIRGMAIPLPKTYDFGGIVNEPISRNDQMFIEWAEWVLHTHKTTAEFVDTPTHAPKYTHSCNRYFRPCSLIPFCDSDREERQLMLDEMATEEWSPLEEGNT